MATTRRRAPARRITSRPAGFDVPRANFNTILIIALIVAAFFSGYLWFKVQNLEKGNAGNQATDTTQQAPQRPTELKIKKPDTSEHWRGSKDVRYVWVEYSDLECPFCKQNHPDLIKLLKEYDGKIAWVYRHFPLSFHQNAQKEAEASECATEQAGNDGFWKYVDAVFSRTTSNGTGFALTSLAPLAGELGMNQATFQQCLDSGKYEQKVKDQFDEGSKAGVQATPTGVIYDLKTGKNSVVEGALPYDQLKQQLDNFMAQNK